jgi:hypothetical protein
MCADLLSAGDKMPPTGRESPLRGAGGTRTTSVGSSQSQSQSQSRHGYSSSSSSSRHVEREKENLYPQHAAHAMPSRVHSHPPPPPSLPVGTPATTTAAVPQSAERLGETPTSTPQRPSRRARGSPGRSGQRGSGHDHASGGGGGGGGIFGRTVTHRRGEESPVGGGGDDALDVAAPDGMSAWPCSMLC